MQVDLTHAILAIVTGSTEEGAVESGGTAPVFRVGDVEERERVAKYIGTVTLGMVHDLRNGTYLIVKH